jgi:adenylate cyclase
MAASIRSRPFENILGSTNIQKPFLTATAIALVVSLIALGLHRTGWIEVAELKSLDYRFQRFANPSQSHPDIVFVTVDEASVKAIGRWPWPRDTHGYAVHYLKAADARIIIFDILFPEPDENNPEFDDVFAQEVKAAGNVLLPALLHDEPEVLTIELTTKTLVLVERPAAPMFEKPFVKPGLKLPIPSLTQATQGIGFINLTPDQDGTTRRIPLLGKVGNVDIPALALVAANAVTGNRHIRLSKESLYFGSTRVPLTQDGQLLINWHGTIENATYPSYSMGAVVRSALEIQAGKPPLLAPHLFKDKIVFIGTSAAGTYDLRVTPLTPYATGALIHMAALDDLLQGKFLTAAPWSILALSIFLLCLTTTWSFTLCRSQAVKVGSTVGVAIAYIAIVVIAFTESHLWLETVVPLGAQGVAFASVATFEYFTEGRRRRQLRAAFDKYMSSEVVDEIMRHPDAITLGGEKRELTVLFSDIAGFTTISEQLSPESLVKLLNQYLSAMTTTIRNHRGNVNKYLGDGIMAIFGAPIKESHHTTLACRTALAMQTQLARLREAWIAEGYPAVVARIGISAGPLIVGNVGSEERLEYTVIGDTVNLASRLEGANKYYGTAILLDSRAYDLAKAEIEARPVDFLRVKGKAQPVVVYELLGLMGQLDPARQQRMKTYREGFEAYRMRAFPKAQACFEQVLDQDPDDCPSQIHRERVMRFQAYPPPLDWDGVFDLQSK